MQFGFIVFGLRGVTWGIRDFLMAIAKCFVHGITYCIAVYIA